MSSLPFRLYLASQSPRRADLLQQIAVTFKRLNIDIDETPIDGEAPSQYVQRVAAEKARSGWQQLEHSGRTLRPVLGADTAVILDQQIMGKPLDRDHGLTMLKALAGRTHQVMSGICFCYKNAEWAALSISDVTFRPISDEELEQYWLSGEPLGKAGAYAIQGLGAVFVEQIRGSYSSVVGLPLLETHQLLQSIEKDTTYE